MKYRFVGGPCHGELIAVSQEMLNSGGVCVRQPAPFRLSDRGKELIKIEPEPIHRHRLVGDIFIHESLTVDEGFELEKTVDWRIS